MLIKKPNSKARFATDQRKRQNMDRLSRDACAALDAGMSYGQYKAIHPHTPDEPEMAPPVPYGMVEKVCVWCGKKYLTKKKNQMYCRDACRTACGRKMKLDRAKARKEQEENNNGQE